MHHSVSRLVLTLTLAEHGSDLYRQESFTPHSHLTQFSLVLIGVPPRSTRWVLVRSRIPQNSRRLRKRSIYCHYFLDSSMYAILEFLALPGICRRGEIISDLPGAE
jgi:hypothetical protein